MQSNKIESLAISVEVEGSISDVSVLEAVNLADYGIEDLAGKIIEFGDKSGSVEYALAICPHFMMLPKAAVGAVIRAFIMEQEKLKDELETAEEPVLVKDTMEPLSPEPKKESVERKVELKRDTAHKSDIRTAHLEHFSKTSTSMNSQIGLEATEEFAKSALLENLGSERQLKVETKDFTAEIQVSNEVDKPTKNLPEYFHEINVPKEVELDKQSFQSDDKLVTEKPNITSLSKAEVIVESPSEEVFNYFNEISALFEEAAATPEYDSNFELALYEKEEVTPKHYGTFDELVAVQSIPENELTFDSITTDLQEQVIEVTLSKIVSYFLKPAEQSEGGKDFFEVSSREIIVKEILFDLHKLLSKQFGHLPNEAKNAVVTPEITQKLLDLLYSLGYQNPEEVLRSFAAKYDISFLMQMMAYLYKIASNEEAHEFVRQVKTHRSKSDDTVYLKLGRTVMAFLSPLIEFPDSLYVKSASD